MKNRGFKNLGGKNGSRLERLSGVDGLLEIVMATKLKVAPTCGQATMPRVVYGIRAYARKFLSVAR